MSPLVKTLLINGLMAGTAARTAKKSSSTFAVYGLGLAVAFVAFVFFCMAGYGWLLEIYAMPVAAAITGAAVLAIALCIAGAGYLKARQSRVVKKPAFDGNFIDNVENAVKSVISGIEEPVKDNPTLALLVAALAGFAAGDHLGDHFGDDETRH